MLVAIAVIAIALLILNSIAEKKIKKSIETNLKNAHTKFEKVDVKLLARNAEIIKPEFQFGNKSISIDTVDLKDIHLWDYLTKKDLVIQQVTLSNPVIKIYPSTKKDSTSGKDSASAKKSQFKNHILLKNIRLRNAVLEMFQQDSSSHKLYTRLSEVKVRDVDVNESTMKESIPFSYNLVKLTADSLFFDMGPRHVLKLRSLEIKDSNLVVSNFRVIPKYSKNEFQKHIQKEKDRYDLVIDSIAFKNLNWKYENDSIIIKSRFTHLDGINFDIYRDKLQPEDSTFKPMYSQMIRNLPIKLGLDSIKVSNMNLKYEENVRENREPGMVQFSNMNAELSNITNIGLGRKDFPKTHIDVRASFMKTASVNVDWDFDISDKSDRFQISGNMGHMQAEQINKFLKPAMNVMAEGEIMDMYFNFYGNDDTAEGDMRLEYKDFKVEVLQKDGKQKNKIVSALANLIVDNKALNKKANYKEIKVERDKARSFWNYFWNCIKSGALKHFL